MSWAQVVRRWRVQTLSDEGSAAVELIIVGPILVLFALVCLQLAVLFFAFMSVITTARDITRWIAVNPNTIDSTAITAVKSRLPSDLDPAKVTISIAPTCSTLTQNKCLNRAAGQDLTVTITYDSSGLYFLPQQYHTAGYTVQLPGTSLTYIMHMQAEPT